MTMYRIDAHVHLFDRSDRVPRGTDDLVPMDRQATLATMLDRLAAEGVDGAVLVPLDVQDEPVRTALDSLSGPFAAVAVASEREQGRSGADAVSAVQQRRRTFAFSGLRTTWLGDPARPLAESPMLPVLKWLAEEGVALWSYLPPEQVVLLDELGSIVPDLSVVLNHLGLAPHAMQVDIHRRPRFDQGLPSSEIERVCRLARHPRFHLMFSGHYALSTVDYPYPDLRTAGQRLLGEFGADRTLWGSDWPWIDEVPGYGATRDVFDTLLPGLTHIERDQILGGTVSHLLNFPAIDR